MRVGVFALQGDYREHLQRLRALGAEAHEVKTLVDLDESDALVLPGGESTTIGFLAAEHDLIDPVRKKIDSGMPIYGTCAGLILLADEVLGGDVPRFGGLDATVRRNAYGRQVDSFEESVDCGPIGRLPGVFIRAPIIERIGVGVESLGTHGGRPVLVRQGNILGGAFHPELIGEGRIHEYFLEEVCRA